MHAKLKKSLKQQAFSLKPVVLLGQKGLTDAVLASIDEALNSHELIKIKVCAENRDLRAQTIDDLSRSTGAEIIQRVGNTALLFRPRLSDTAINLP